MAIIDTVHVPVQAAVEPREPDVVRDPGAEARERLQKRSFSQAFRKVLLKMFMVVLVVLAGWGAMAFAAISKEMTTGTTTDYRECKWPIGKLEITGRRSFTYPYTEVLGHRIIDTSRVTESTTINLPRDAVTVVGITDKDNWWGGQQDEGPPGTMNLKPGKVYVVVVGKNYGAFDHDSFCNQQSIKKEI